MNERAREALVAAALNGTKQIKGAHFDESGGRCAMGVIWEALGVEMDVYSPGVNAAMKKAGMSWDEYGAVLDANDEKNWDFLTIARKIGNDDAVVNLTQEATK